jgi:hypothetical protein
MKYKEIKLEGNKSVLVDESAKIKDVDWHIDNGIVKQWKGNLHSNRLTSKKITATINHSVSLDVPMVIVEDELEKLAKEIVISNNPNGVENFSMVVFNGLSNDITEALKAQQKGLYSEEDLKNACHLFHNRTIKTIYEIIESLKQEYIELEIETYFTDDAERNERLKKDGENIQKQYVLKTNRVDGQLMAYVKQ